MSYSAKTTASRAAAGTMAAIFAMSAFSFDQAFISASAESLAAYTVRFTNSNGDLQDVDGVKVTLTSAADPNALGLQPAGHRLPAEECAGRS